MPGIPIVAESRLVVLRLEPMLFRGDAELMDRGCLRAD